jgi:hypothetical protein
MREVKLQQCLYVSHQVHDFSDVDLQRLLVKARRKNRELSLTGLLLFDKPMFLQILEGPPDSINRIIADIKSDDRHCDLDVIYFDEDRKEREFARWLMGAVILGNRQSNDYKNLDSRVKDILNAAKPNGKLAHQLLSDFRTMKNSFIDIQQ